MINKSWRGTMVALLSVWTVGLAAQQQAPGFQQPPGLKTGNPTPGTAQPEPPNLARRIALTGCVQAAENRSGPGAAATDANSPSDSRFVLTSAERPNVVPRGAGTARAATEPADRPADVSVSRRYRLRAIDSQLSPFVGARVEISGEVLPAASRSDEDSANPPTLQVEFVQRVAMSCS